MLNFKGGDWGVKISLYYVIFFGKVILEGFKVIDGSNYFGGKYYICCK